MVFTKFSKSSLDETQNNNLHSYRTLALVCKIACHSFGNRLYRFGFLLASSVAFLSLAFSLLVTVIGDHTRDLTRADLAANGLISFEDCTMYRAIHRRLNVHKQSIITLLTRFVIVEIFELHKIKQNVKLECSYIFKF